MSKPKTNGRPSPQEAAERHMEQMNKSERRRKLQAVNKKIKRGYEPKPARRRDWLPDDPEAWDAVDYAPAERVMPLDERERRRTLEQAIFAEPGADAATIAHSLAAGSAQADLISEPEPAGPVGVVMESSNGICRVAVGEEVLLCALRGNLLAQRSLYTQPVIVGDRVILTLDGAGGGVVEEVLPRLPVLARPDVFAGHLQQAISANVDQLLIVSAWREPALWLELIDRYLIAAERFRLTATICINKIDLAEDLAECHAMMAPYRSLGYAVVMSSAVTGAGLDAVRLLMLNQTSVLSGLSGVGKSTLLSAIFPGLNLRTGETSERRHEGKHTTTQATFLRVDGRTAVVDTPGIRDFGVAGLRPNELAAFFPEVADLAGGCRFSDCSHRHEPNCAVRAGVDDGRIAPSRYKSYVKIYEELTI